MILRFASHSRRKMKGDPSGLQNYQTTEKQIRTKSKEEENGQNPGCYKPTPLKEISSSRFGCSGIKHEYSHLRKPFPTRVSFLSLYNVPTEFHMTGCLASWWFALLDPFSSKSYLIRYSDFTPFVSADLSGA